MEGRRNEIDKRLDRLGEESQFELERNPEDQAIRLKQNEVSITMEAICEKS